MLTIRVNKSVLNSVLFFDDLFIFQEYLDFFAGYCIGLLWKSSVSSLLENYRNFNIFFSIFKVRSNTKKFPSTFTPFIIITFKNTQSSRILKCLWSKKLRSRTKSTNSWRYPTNITWNHTSSKFRSSIITRKKNSMNMKNTRIIMRNIVAE